MLKYISIQNHHMASLASLRNGIYWNHFVLDSHLLQTTTPILDELSVYS